MLLLADFLDLNSYAVNVNTLAATWGIELIGWLWPVNELIAFVRLISSDNININIVGIIGWLIK